MTATQCLTKSDEKTALEACRTIRELLAGSERKTLALDETGAVRSYLATCHPCRGEYDRLAAVPAHLSLRDAGPWQRPKYAERPRVPGPIAATRRPVTAGHTERA